MMHYAIKVHYHAGGHRCSGEQKNRFGLEKKQHFLVPQGDINNHIREKSLAFRK